MDLPKQIMGIQFKIFKSQMDYVTKVTNSFIIQNDRSPFENISNKFKKINQNESNELNNTNETNETDYVKNILPLVEFDSFENSLVPLLNDSGGINNNLDSSEALIKLLNLYELTIERKAIILEILSNTRLTPTLNFLSKGGLEILLSWLKISTSSLRDGIPLSSLHHLLLFLLRISHHTSLFTPTIIADLKESHQSTSRLLQNTKVTCQVGFDHLVTSGNPFSPSTFKQTTTTLKQTILNLYEELVVRVQGKGASTIYSAPNINLSSTSNTTSNTSSSNKRNLNEPSTSSIKKKSKKEIPNIVQEEKNHQSMKELSKNILAAKEKKVLYSSTDTFGGSSIHKPIGSIGRAMPYTGPSNLASSSLTTSISSIQSSTEIISTLLTDPTALPPSKPITHSNSSSNSSNHSSNKKDLNKSSSDYSNSDKYTNKLNIDKGSNLGKKNQKIQQEPDEDEFTSFGEVAKVQQSDLTADTQYNSLRRKIKWGDEIDGKQLSYIKEFESLQPLNEVSNISTSSESGNDEEDIDQKLLTEVITHSHSRDKDHSLGSNKERLSYSMLRKREREAERQGIRLSHQVAEKKTLQSLREMIPSTTWMSPLPRILTQEELDIMDDLTSHELKIQTQRLSRKTEVIYLSDEQIPRDPDPPSQLSSSLNDPTQYRPALTIPWTDNSVPEHSTVNQEEIQAGLSALPDYVTSLNETELGILVEKLSEPRYRHLLENTSHPGFMELVEDISPGVIARHLAAISDESIYPTGGYSDHHGRNMYNDYNYDNYSSNIYQPHAHEENDFYYSPQSHNQLHNNSTVTYDNVDREWERNNGGGGGSWKGGNNNSTSGGSGGNVGGYRY